MLNYFHFYVQQSMYAWCVRVCACMCMYVCMCMCMCMCVSACFHQISALNPLLLKNLSTVSQISKLTATTQGSLPFKRHVISSRRS